MKRTIEITRKNRNIGWGWQCWTPEHPEPPAKPDYTGTVKTIIRAIANDRTFQSLGGTYYTTQWFIKLDGHWYPFEWDAGYPDWLYQPYARDPWGNSVYLYDGIYVEIEE